MITEKPQHEVYMLGFKHKAETTHRSVKRNSTFPRKDKVYFHALLMQQVMHI